MPELRERKFPILWTAYHTILVLELAILIGIQISILVTLNNLGGY